ncbi:MAG: PD-(D/E)XK nuclease family protein [Thermodesulfobacteriaceae bacterium]|nr:PD-(D/E)XK nuclease family protein [Thermodesulfobacteriaceae bacterium]
MLGKLYLVDLSLNLFEVLIQHLLERNHLSSALILFPHRRAVEFLKYYLSKIVQKPLILPEIKAFMDWVIEYSAEVQEEPEVLLNILDQAWLIYQSVLEVSKKEGGSFPQWFRDWEKFLPWAIKLAELFQEFEQELKEVKDFLYPPEEVLPSKAVELLENQGKIYQEFIKLLKKKGYTTASQQLKFLAETEVPLPQKPTYIVGFYALTKAEDRLFRKFFERGSYFYWHTQVDQLSELHEKWLLEWQRDYNLKPIKIYGNKSVPQFYFFEAHDLHSELEELKSRLPQNLTHLPPDEIAIVLPCADNLIPVLHYLPSLSVNVTLGYPLKFTPWATLLNSLFELVLKYHPERGFKTSSFLEFLKSPYLEILKNLIQRLTTYGGSYIKKEKILEMVDQGERAYLETLLVELVEPLILADTPFKVSQVLKESFKILKLKEPASALDREVLFTFVEGVLKMIDSLFFTKERMSKRGIFNLFKEILNYVTIPFEGDPLTGIQVLGLLETRLLSFKKVYILDLNEGILPSLEDINPLLPQKVRKILGISDKEREETIIRYHLERLIYSAKEVHLFWQYSTSARSELGLETKKIRSRYVEKLIWEIEKSERKFFEETSYKENFKKSQLHLVPESFRLEKFLIKFDFLRERILENLNLISATLLEEYLKCPLQFFYHRILQIEPLKKEEEIAYDELGKAVHSALEEYFEEVTGLRGETNLLGIEVFKEQLDFKKLWKIFLKKLETQRFYQSISPERRFLLEETAKFRLKKFLEETHPKVTKIVTLEKRIESFLNLDTLGNFRIGGVIDRVDLRESEGSQFYLILDYKTGFIETPNKRFLELTKEKILKMDYSEEALKSLRTTLNHLQLLFYIYLWKKYLEEKNQDSQIIEAAYVKLYRDGREEFLKLRHEPEGIKWFKDCFPLILEFIIKHLLYSPYWYPAKEKNHCNFCPYFSMCKYSV